METDDDGNIHTKDSPPEAQETELVIRHSDRSSEPPDQVIDREIIDDDGDVLARTDSKEFLISSKILELASPVFTAMFNARFLERTTPRSVQNPLKLSLPDNDSDAWIVLFHTLHFSSKRRFLNLGADLQLHVAQLAVQYQCTTSISAESGRWLRSLSGSDHGTSILWTSSTIAFLMGHMDEFSIFTAKLVLKSTAAELDHTAPNSALPETLKGALHRLRTRLLCGMMGEVEEVIDELRRDEQNFETGGKLCTICRRYKPPPTKKCHSCRNDEFLPIYCDAESRVCEFLEALSSAKVWPLSRQMDDSAVAFQRKLEPLPSRLDHDCNGYNRCPLPQVAKALKDKVGGFMAQSEGLDLRAFQRNIQLGEGDIWRRR